MLEILFFLLLAAVPVVGLMWWLDRLIKRSQGRSPSSPQRGFEVKIGAGQFPVPPNELKPREPSEMARDTLKGDHG
jgi:hypothetical protein